MPQLYERDGAAIYRQSFRTIRAEAALTRFSREEERVAVRMIHAAGLVGLERHIRFSPGFAHAAIVALEGGAPILCDARMVSEGITVKRLPAANPILCTLNDPQRICKTTLRGKNHQMHLRKKIASPLSMATFSRASVSNVFSEKSAAVGSRRSRP